MSKIITGQTIYDDFISACRNDNSGLYYESGSVSTKPTYSQVMNGLLTDNGDSYLKFYTCSKTDPTKCVISTGPGSDDYIDVYYTFGDIFSEASSHGFTLMDLDDEIYLNSTETEDERALTDDDFVETDMSISKNFAFARATMQGELPGVFDFPGSCKTATLTIKAKVSGLNNYDTIARIDNLGDRDYMELDYNPYLMMPA